PAGEAAPRAADPRRPAGLRRNGRSTAPLGRLLRGGDRSQWERLLLLQRVREEPRLPRELRHVHHQADLQLPALRTGTDESGREPSGCAGGFSRPVESTAAASSATPFSSRRTSSGRAAAATEQWAMRRYRGSIEMSPVSWCSRRWRRTRSAVMPAAVSRGWSSTKAKQPELKGRAVKNAGALFAGGPA